MEKRIIFDESQFIFKPILETISEKKQLKILIEITSYMNSDILDLNYKQQSMLEINNNIIIADNWDILDRSKYKVIGQ